MPLHCRRLSYQLATALKSESKVNHRMFIVSSVTLHALVMEEHAPASRRADSGQTGAAAPEISRPDEVAHPRLARGAAGAP
jgi:hypothetical protein